MRKPLECSAVFDIETEDWTTFVMGGIRDANGTEIFEDEDSLVDALLQIEGRVWAHNLGRFDGLWLLDRLHERGAKVEVANAASRVVSCKVGQTEFCDSLALVPMSLAEWTGEKESTGLPCRCKSGCGCSKGCLAAEGCGGYCSISRNMPPKARSLLRSYLHNDLHILWKSLHDLESFAQTHDLDLLLTIGGSSWSTVQRVLELPKADYRGTAKQTGWKGLTYEGIRDGYYGGRCQVFRPKMAQGYLADVNSMYPAQLATVPMPVGQPRDASAPSKDYAKGRSGVFLARVSVPEMFIPPLPRRVRDKSGSHRIAYPTGTFDGTWTGLELRYAECAGTRVLQVFRGIVWDREEVIFDTWIDRLFQLRAKAGKKTWLGKWLKLFMNSLTGKFAMRPSRARYLFHPNESQLKAWHRIYKKGPETYCEKFCGNKENDPEKCRGHCGASVEVSPGIWKGGTYFVNPCAHVEWAAHLTAGARICIGEHLARMGEQAVYTDTDSIFSGRRPKGLGTHLGELEDKGRFKNFEALSPKVYSYQEDDGTPIYAAKGISNPEVRWARIAAGETVESGRIRGFVTGAKQGNFFKRDQIKRSVKLAVARDGAYGDRVIDGEVTRARDIKEFRLD